MSAISNTSLQDIQEMENLKRFKESQDVKIDWKNILDTESFKLVMAQCEELSCAAELVLFPMLTSIAHFMGTKATVKIDSDWVEPTLLMCLLVARRGERKTCALHRTKQSCVALEEEIQAMKHMKREIKECSDAKPISLIDQFNIQTELDNALQITNNNPLMIIIDDFKETLDTLDKSKDIFRNSRLKEIYGCGMEDFPMRGRPLNFIGTIQAIDVHSVFENRERISMFDRSLIVCCKNFVEGVKDSANVSNSMQTILSSIRNFHSLQSDQSYTFNSGGQTEFTRCLGIFQRMKKIYTDNKMVFGSINQAGGHLARLSAILTALRNGVAMGNNNTYLPSRVIDQETVKRAYQIVRFILQQKLCLFASKSDNEWPEMVDENDNANWKIETDDQSERSMNVTTTGSYADEYSYDVIEVTQQNERVDRFVTGLNEKFESDDVEEATYRYVTENEMIPKSRYQQSNAILKCNMSYESGRPEMDNRLMEYFVPITSQVPAMSSHTRHPASDTSAHVQSASPKVAKPSDIHIPPPPMLVNNKQNINKKCLPPPYEGSIYDTDDEIFFQQCANKIKKLLLTHGAVVTASYACQYRLFPPVPMDLRQKSPRTSHPSWAASRFFERLEGLEIGSMHVLRGHSVRFRKEPYSKMSERGKEILRRLRVLPDEYEDTFPECSVFDELKFMQMSKDSDDNDMKIVFNNQ